MLVLLDVVVTHVHPRLIDCIVVNDEQDLLQDRLNYLAPYVDAFVVVEARVDHRGRGKLEYT